VCFPVDVARMYVNVDPPVDGFEMLWSDTMSATGTENPRTRHPEVDAEASIDTAPQAGNAMRRNVISVTNTQDIRLSMWRLRYVRLLLLTWMHHEGGRGAW